MSVSNQVQKVGVYLLNYIPCKNKKGERTVTISTRGDAGEQQKHCICIDHSPCFHLRYAQPDLKGQLNEFSETNLF